MRPRRVLSDVYHHTFKTGDSPLLHWVGIGSPLLPEVHYSLLCLVVVQDEIIRGTPDGQVLYADSWLLEIRPMTVCELYDGVCWTG